MFFSWMMEILGKWASIGRTLRKVLLFPSSWSARLKLRCFSIRRIMEASKKLTKWVRTVEGSLVF